MMKTQTYRVAPNMKAMAVQGLIYAGLLSLITTYCALFAPPRDKNQLLPMYLVLSFAYGGVAFFVWMLRVCNTYLEVTDDQIVQHTPGKPPFALKWSNVATIKNNKIMQRLELHSNTKGRAIMVEHQVQGFDELRNFIEGKTGRSVA